MKSRAIALITLVLLVGAPLASPTIGAQDSTADDPRQPSLNSTKMFLFGVDSGADFWAHFNDTDEESSGSYEETATGNSQLAIDIELAMRPELATNFVLDPNGTITGSITMDLNFDADNDNQGVIEPLTITLTSGSKEIGEQVYEALTTGQKAYVFDFNVTQESDVFDQWMAGTDNPTIRIQVTLQGTSGVLIFPGNPASFSLTFGSTSNVDFPITVESEDASIFEEAAVVDESGGLGWLWATLGVIGIIVLALGGLHGAAIASVGKAGLEGEDEDYWSQRVKTVPVMGPISWFTGGGEEESED